MILSVLSLSFSLESGPPSREERKIRRTFVTAKQILPREEKDMVSLYASQSPSIG